MQYEVEQKFRLADPAAFERAARRLSLVLEQPLPQSDEYFAHPARDFAKTDEALRIRSLPGRCLLTYKGPKVDSQTKTRREIELPLAGGEESWRSFRELLLALGFRPVALVTKQRKTAHLASAGIPFEIALDEVSGLGSFVELETQARAEGLAAAQQALAELAQRLELAQVERRSYLELVLERAEAK